MTQSDDRQAVSTGIAWAYRITSLGLEFVLPTLGGYYLDRRWGTLPLATLLGAGLGFVVGLVHLVQIARKSSQT